MKATLPNARAWVSGWALSWRDKIPEQRIEGKVRDRTKSFFLNLFSPQTYNNLESVEQRWSVGQTAKLKVAGVIFGDVSICAGAEKHFLYVADK